MTEEDTFSQDTLAPSPSGAAPGCARPLGTHREQSARDEAAGQEAGAGMEESFDRIAAGLYSLASMLVGPGEESVRLVESAVAAADFSACEDAPRAERSGRMALARTAIEVLGRRDPAGLAAPEPLEQAPGCIQDDELDVAAVARDELATLLAGPDRERVRAWLSSLPTALRVIFVLRAVAAFGLQEIAGLLRAAGGETAAGWTPDAVREVFRRALCSLASQLLHESTAR